MKKLFDETFEVNRTLWYGYYEELNEDFKNEIIELLKNEESPQEIKATSWIFYKKNKTKDAIDDELRESLMISLINGIYKVHYNMSDFSFVVMYDSIIEFCQDLENKL